MSFFCIFVSKILKGENWFLKYILYGDLIEEKNKIKDFIKTEDWD
jgi:hypothetical protein